MTKGINLHHEHKRLPHQNPRTTSRPQYIQTTRSQLSKRNGSWCSHFHILYAFPAHNRHGHHRILLPPRNTRIPLFYGLPKIHKPNCSLRPIVSGCDGPTDRLSSYTIHFNEPLANNLLSHIKDVKRFLNLIENFPELPTKCILGHNWCHVLMAYQPSYISCRNKTISYPQTVTPPYIAHAILNSILKHSTFNFMDTHIHHSHKK